MNYTDKNTYLTYSLWNGTNRKGINLNPRELLPYEIQQIIDSHVFSRENDLKELRKENKRLEKLLDQLLNENANYKRVQSAWQARYDAD